MPCQNWFDLVEHYRAAVHTYGDAVDRFRGASSGDPETAADREGAWQGAEQARRGVDRARAALLLHERNHTCFAARAAAGRPDPSRAPSEAATDDMILGDQGQSGG
jgi:hypothetical protein